MNHPHLVNMHINGGSPRTLPPIDINRTSSGTPTATQFVPHDGQKIQSLEVEEFEGLSCSSSESDFEEETTPFIPRTSVLNGKMEFSSDEENEPVAGASAASHQQQKEKEDLKVVLEMEQQQHQQQHQLDPCQLWNDISLDGHNVNVSIVADNLGSLETLVGCFSTEMWQTCLTNEQRTLLSHYLPNLNGWKGLSETQAQLENLQALFQGDNFNFGNPLHSLSKEILQGKRTTKNYSQRLQVMKWQRREYLLRRQVYTQELLKSIHKNRSYYIGTKGPGNPETSNKSDEEVNPITAYTKVTNRIYGKRVQPSSSLFLAIVNYVKEAKNGVTINDLWEHLEKFQPNLITFQNGIPSYLDAKDFVESILLFLTNPLGSNPIVKCENHDSIFDVPCMEFVKENASYLWKGGDRKYIPEQLLLLEQFFLTQTKRSVKSTSQYGSAMKAAHQRARRIVEAEAVEVVSKRPSVVQAEEVSKRAKSFLRESSVATHPEQMGIASLELFQAQERERYRQPTRAYTFLDPSTGVRATVGPTFATLPSIDSVSFLVPDRQSSVTLLNLVRDAAARLPGRSGTRADIRNLLKHSQFCLNGTPNDILDVAVVSALNVLSEAPDPCVIFQARYGKWMYLHGDRPVERFEDIARSVKAGGVGQRSGGFGFSNHTDSRGYAEENSYFGSRQGYGQMVGENHSKFLASSGEDDSSLGSRSGDSD